MTAKILRTLETSFPAALTMFFFGALALVATGLSAMAATGPPAMYPLIAAAITYVAVFLTVAWTRPDIALMLVFLAAPFQNDLSGGGGFAKFSIAEINLALALPVFLAKNLVRKRPLLNGPIFVPMAAYFAVCLYASYVNWQGNEAIISILQMFLYMHIAVTVFASFTKRGEDLYLALNGLVFMGVALTIASFATGFTFLGLHKNGIGSSLAACLLVSVELWFAAPPGRRSTLLTLAVAITAAGLLYSLSRGAWLGALAGMMVIVLLRRQYVLLARGALLLIPLVAVLWYVMPQQSKEYATGFGAERTNISARYQSIDTARTYYNQSPIYGMGVGLRKAFDATNIIWFTLAETGVLGLLAFLWIHAAAFHMIWKTQRFLERTDSLYSCLAVGGALLTSKFVHGVVDHYWSRGALMMAWTSFGMATCAYYTVRDRLAQSGVRL